jgi:hypothetical protein
MYKMNSNNQDNRAPPRSRSRDRFQSIRIRSQSRTPEGPEGPDNRNQGRSQPQTVSSVESELAMESSHGEHRPVEVHKVCGNCGIAGHYYQNCRNNCSGCGSTDHKLPQCNLSVELRCVCTRYPYHNLVGCPLMCEFVLCPREHEPHRAVLCTAQCILCGDWEHAANQCPTKRKGCRCGNGDHPTSLHPGGPLECSALNCHFWFCGIHCQKCYFKGHRDFTCPNEVKHGCLNDDLLDETVVYCPFPNHEPIRLGSAESCSHCDKVSKEKFAAAVMRKLSLGRTAAGEFSAILDSGSRGLFSGGSGGVGDDEIG